MTAEEICELVCKNIPEIRTCYGVQMYASAPSGHESHRINLDDGCEDEIGHLLKGSESTITIT